MADKKIPLKDHGGIAREFRAVQFDEERKILIFNNGDFYWWHNPHWEMQEMGGIKAQLWGHLSDRAPESKDISGAIEALKGITFEPATTQAPCWMKYWPDQPAAHDIIPCNNGLLDINSRQLLGLTEDFFNLNYLPIDYQAEAQEPKQWLEFLNSLFPDDPGSVECLQEIFGYLLTQDTTQHKIFLLIGPKRSGKGTIARILTALLGRQNVAAPTLTGLVSTPYACECLLNTQLAIIGDARLGPRADTTAISEILLGISGEDSMTIPRKYKSAWTGKLNTRFLIMTNEVPALNDASGALAGRLIALETQQSFYGQEDLGLQARLMTELQEILHWALTGLSRLRSRGHFLQPESGLDLRDELQRSSSPISQFIEDRCEVGMGYQIECGVLFEAYSVWCGTQGRKPGTIQTLGRALKAAAPLVRTTRPRIDGKRERFYENIRKQY